MNTNFALHLKFFNKQKHFKDFNVKFKCVCVGVSLCVCVCVSECVCLCVKFV